MTNNFEHQTVSLKGMTFPVMEDNMNISSIEDFIVYCARVSNPNSQAANLNNSGLLNYLIRNKHWSPFEMASMTMEINTTRDIARQILRHRSFSFQEFSQRYAAVDDSSFAHREARAQDHKNRQNSIEYADNAEIFWWHDKQQEILEHVKQNYYDALEKGIAKEQARAILPEGLTMSRLYMAGTIRSFIHYCDLRCGNGTQREHQDVALKVRDILIEEMPSLGDYFGQEQSRGTS